MKTWHHPTACRFQSWNTSDHGNRTGTQSHPSIKRPPKDFLIIQPPLGTHLLDKAQPTKEPRSTFHHSLSPPGRSTSSLGPASPPGSRQLSKNTPANLCGAESTNRLNLNGPAGTPPLRYERELYC